MRRVVTGPVVTEETPLLALGDRAHQPRIGVSVGQPTPTAYLHAAITVRTRLWEGPARVQPAAHQLRRNGRSRLSTSGSSLARRRTSEPNSTEPPTPKGASLRFQSRDAWTRVACFPP